MSKVEKIQLLNKRGLKHLKTLELACCEIISSSHDMSMYLDTYNKWSGKSYNDFITPELYLRRKIYKDGPATMLLRIMPKVNPGTKNNWFGSAGYHEIYTRYNCREELSAEEGYFHVSIHEFNQLSIAQLSCLSDIMKFKYNFQKPNDRTGSGPVFPMILYFDMESTNDLTAFVQDYTRAAKLSLPSFGLN